MRESMLPSGFPGHPEPLPVLAAHGPRSPSATVKFSNAGTMPQLFLRPLTLVYSLKIHVSHIRFPASEPVLSCHPWLTHYTAFCLNKNIVELKKFQIFFSDRFGGVLLEWLPEQYFCPEVGTEKFACTICPRVCLPRGCRSPGLNTTKATLIVPLPA